MRFRFSSYLFFLLLGIGSLLAQQPPPAGAPSDSAQKKIKVRNSQRLVYQRQDTTSIQRLIGKVIIQHDSTWIYCDSMYFFDEENRVKAFSRVRVEMPDSVTMYCDRLDYDGNTRIAKAFSNIVLTNGKSRLETEELFFFRNENYGEYRNGGVLYNNDDTLTSKAGYYYPDENMAYFKGEVELRNPEYQLETDTLGYQTEDRTAIFLAPTRITNEDGTLLTSKGSYDTYNRKINLLEGNQLENEDYTISGDTLNFDSEENTGVALGNVNIQPKDSTMFIQGEYSKFFRDKELSYVTRYAVAVQYLDDDTLYITADTLYTFEDSNENRVFKAFRHVFLYLNDMQGRCDSLVYRYNDSTIELYYDPVLWSDSSQLSADSIRIFMANDQVDSMSMIRNAMVVSMEDTVGFNQIKGKRMEVQFEDNQLQLLDVSGNSETIYFGKDDETGSYLAMSKSSSQRMHIFFEENKVVKVKNIKDVQSNLNPYWEIMFEPNLLEGVRWRVSERPQKPLSARAFAEEYAVLPALPVPAEGIIPTEAEILPEKIPEEAQP